MRFRDVKIGQTFDWQNPYKPWLNSFFPACKKISARKYIAEGGVVHEVGTINASVYHVGLYDGYLDEFWGE